jgi:hypothetical protein
MIKIRVHIHSEESFMDEKVFLDIELPFVPQKGDTLFLTEGQKRDLKIKAISNLIIAKRYSPKWFYGGSFHCINPTEENLEDLSFDDALTVHRVCYYANEDLVHLEITNSH